LPTYLGVLDLTNARRLDGAPQPEPNADVAQAQIGGLGLSLVRQIASSLSYDSSGGQNRLPAVFTAG
jgi:anti-sigma regulatory factor (Ser/Thr protein kinase)